MIVFGIEYGKITFVGGSMKFENLMYCGKEIKVIVYLDDCFVESNDIKEDENDTLDLTNITKDLDDELEVLM